MEGTEEVDSLSYFNLLVYYSRLVGEALYGSYPVTYLRCFRNFLACLS